MNNKQKLEYALKLKKLHEIMVIKNHIYFAHQNANFNRAAYLIDNVMDQHLNEHITTTIDGTISLSNHQEKLDEAISSALTNQRKMVLKKTNRYIDKAVENNINTYGTFLKNRINKEAVSLANKIEEEARKKEYKHLSDTETKKILTEKFQNHGRRRAKNIIRDALHTNQSNISWIHGIQQDYKYKVWMNGRVKGRTRPWHKAKKIQPVHMDEFFDIYGSYHATMMYPGDLNGGAENVANCRCWLKYTNEKPNNLKTRGLFSISNNVELKTADKTKTKVTTTNQENVLEPKHKITEKIKTKIQNTVKNIKNKIKRNNFNINEFTHLKNIKNNSNLEKTFKNNGETNLNIQHIPLREELIPEDLPEIVKDNMLKFDEKIVNAEWEYGQVINLTQKEAEKIMTDYNIREVNPIKDKLYGDDELAVPHSHLGYHPFNPDDFEVISDSKNFIKMMIVHTPLDVFIVEFNEKFSFELEGVKEALNECYGYGLISGNSKGITGQTNAIWSNYENNKVLNLHMSFRRIRK